MHLRLPARPQTPCWAAEQRGRHSCGWGDRCGQESEQLREAEGIPSLCTCAQGTRAWESGPSGQEGPGRAIPGRV